VLKAHLPRGRYAVRARAVDKLGHLSHVVMARPTVR
jgi:hypothetical protein